MGATRDFSRVMLATAAALTLATAAFAQFSDSYSFLKAVKDADGAKTMEFLNKPGQPVLNARDPASGDAALHMIVKRHDQTWLSFLIGRGAQVDVRDRDGNTPLMTAVQLSDPASAQLLVESGAKVNLVNNRGETPLIMAVQHRDVASARLLISAGADPKIADTIAGKSAHDYATEDSRAAPILRMMDEAKPKAPAAEIAGPVRR
ncbi:ankyrin repeat domain-containing protein [Sphingomonas nostoxanthinifaciens]|uniref:ankyrin repeat domain-containing protein n=1 Tax=Sphingomonas nostoxanthinifaciens TaxID=2872652 RepID=UPI001CC208A6|nr:ankyrin repeat domain-containing protein [Sphingomonas nostoxanthinifaciens]UAK24641.1 ankyrin repeat domain-containing protein [Sphingomonas nostoxanthinifaciens]